MTFRIGNTVYLKAARVFDAALNRSIYRPRTGPFVIENVYLCGQHQRIKATSNGPVSEIDAATHQFEREG